MPVEMKTGDEMDNAENKRIESIKSQIDSKKQMAKDYDIMSRRCFTADASRILVDMKSSVGSDLIKLNDIFKKEISTSLSTVDQAQYQRINLCQKDIMNASSSWYCHELVHSRISFNRSI